ncbi:MAG: response regulator [Candidatus Tectomicrobia bacterium]|uniref:histidine kinase n=1 Tax=Tectimicrobiota bacterium TaxID=2528274 RepID=A0A932CN78_UNCTE|nr:response regulator [Candidatus Tectomicrobia bacterium]
MEIKKEFKNATIEMLIAEDSPTQAEKLRYILEREGYHVVVAQDGKSALALARTHKPMMVISDVVMPGMDGYELCRAIKTDEILKDTPVVLLTILSDAEDVFRGLECGADNFITKPYDEKYLLLRIEYILGNQRLHRSKNIQMGVEFFFKGQKHLINADRMQILDFLLSTYETAIQKNFELIQAQDALRKLNGELERKVEERTAALTAEIAERQQREEKIREQATLLDIVQDAIFVRSLEGSILFWNQGAERIYGWTAAEAMGQNADELLGRGDAAPLEEARQGVIAAESWIGELQQVTRAGQGIVVQSRWTLMHDSEGRPKSVLVVGTDITAKKQLESQFLRAQRMESIGALASGIAHDLNNVLSPILMGVEILRGKLSDVQSQWVLGTVEENVKRGKELVKQVLMFGRGIEGKRVAIQPRHLIREMAGVLKETFPKQIEIRTDIASDLWAICGDATQLHQILMNLCVNARDAMPEGGTLTIAAENFFIDENYALIHLDARVGPYIALAVSDTGTGIPPAIQDRIFEPFFTTKEIGKGTGFGLSTVISIVKGHEGFVDVYSKVGNGTAFKVYLPAIEMAEAEEQAYKRPDMPTGNGEMVLVVDDEASIREITRATLETYGYRVIMAGDGEEAIALYLQHQAEIQVVLMDIMMPVMEGMISIRALREMNRHLKILAVSGLPTDELIQEATAMGVQAFLRKPYTGEKLLNTLHEILHAS